MPVYLPLFFDMLVGLLNSHSPVYLDVLEQPTYITDKMMGIVSLLQKGQHFANTPTHFSFIHSVSQEVGL